jgi:hypothetical protein
VAKCRTDILKAQSQISVGESNIPPVKRALKAHRDSCKAQVKTSHKKLKALRDDIQVISKILQMTDCGNAFLQLGRRVGQGVRVLRCKHACDKKSFISFRHPPLRSHINSLKSQVAHELLQRSFRDLSVDRNGTSVTDKLRKTQVTANPCYNPNKGAPTPQDKRAAKCTVSGSATCGGLQERFSLIQSGLGDERENQKAAVVQLEHDCEATEQTLSKNVEKADQVLKQHQAKLAEATGCENEAAESGRLSNKEFEQMSSEMEKEKVACTTNYQQIETEMCGLRKIRGELYSKMQGTGQKPFIVDCKVSTWASGECSKECGGGVMDLTRSIESQPQGGAECPPLTETRRCNEQPCPVDCEMEEWNGWSSCSAQCGGGIQERLRDVKRPMKHNGNPCGETSETKACGVGSCEADCELEDKWSAWTNCSKACDGGTHRRVKYIKTPAVGQGDCPDERSKEREQFKKCNVHECPQDPAKKTIQCDDKLDFILVLDGSSSLKKKGWKATKKAAALILGALDENKTQAGVLVYSGPDYYPEVQKCWDSNKMHQEFACKMKWVQHLGEGDMKSAKTRVKALSWPKGGTLTSLALQNALADTQNGRPDARTVVMVITDGKPMSSVRTFRAASALRRVARLVWVPVTSFAPLANIRRMASKPWQENVVLANTFDTLKKPSFINHVIADICPHIKKPKP